MSATPSTDDLCLDPTCRYCFDVGELDTFSTDGFYRVTPVNTDSAAALHRVIGKPSASASAVDYAPILHAMVDVLGMASVSVHGTVAVGHHADRHCSGHHIADVRYTGGRASTPTLGAFMFGVS